MIRSFNENIRFPERTKNAGYVLVSGATEKNRQILYEAMQLFFGAFGTHAVFYGNGNFAFCLLLPDQLPKLDRYSIYQQDQNFAFIEGTFYDRDILTRFNGDGGTQSHPEFAEWVFKSTMKAGPGFLKDINGHYSGFLYDSAADSLFCFNDRFSVHKQFLYDASPCFVLSNNIFAIARNRHLDITVNEEAVCQVMQLDYPQGRNTEFTNIRSLLPSDIVIRKNQSMVFRQIDSIVFNRENRSSSKACIRQLYDRFDAFMKFLNTCLDEPQGIFLSRGKDSRMLLHFLEKYNNYQLFTFMTQESAWSFLEGKQVAQIAEKLERDLSRLDDFTIDRNIALLAGMNTTATSSWMALAQLASNNVNYAYIGHGGDVLSGKLEAFRFFTLEDKKVMMQILYDVDRKGVTFEDITTLFPHLRHYDHIAEQYFDSFDSSPEYSIYDLELKQMIDYRWFRHSVPIQHKANQYLTPIYPYLEKNICNAYLTLPVSLIRSQRAHAHLAAFEKKSNMIRSTEFPIPLIIEKNIRPLMMQIIKMNNRFNDRFFEYVCKKKSGKAGNLMVGHDNQSTYMKQTLGDRIELKNKQLLHRIKVLDAYLFLAFDHEFSSLCNRVDSVENMPGDSNIPPGANNHLPVSSVAKSGS